MLRSIGIPREVRCRFRLELEKNQKPLKTFIDEFQCFLKRQLSKEEFENVMKSISLTEDTTDELKNNLSLDQFKFINDDSKYTGRRESLSNDPFLRGYVKMCIQCSLKDFGADESESSKASLGEADSALSLAAINDDSKVSKKTRTSSDDFSLVDFMEETSESNLTDFNVPDSASSWAHLGLGDSISSWAALDIGDTIVPEP